MNVTKTVQQLLAHAEEISNQLKTNPPSSLSELNAKRDALKRTLEKILLYDYDFARQHDVETKLWRNAIYKQIEEFRRQIRRLKGKHGDKGELDRVKAEMRAHLQKSSGFYHDVIDRFKTKYNLDLDHPVRPDDPNLKYYECCFRCLVFIGDLARYHRDLDEPAMQSNDIENARSYYMRAHRLMPSYGNPHNQLAVLSTYEDDSINALYRYYRAIGSAHPFTTAADNLNVLLTRAKQALDEFEADPTKRSKLRKYDAQKRELHAFGLRFTLLHSYLFNRVYEDFNAQAVCRDLALLLENKHLVHHACEILIPIFACSIFVVQRVLAPQTRAQSVFSDTAQRLELLHKFFTLAMSLFFIVARSYLTVALTGKDNVLRAKLLAPLSIFCGWLKTQPALFDDNLLALRQNDPRWHQFRPQFVQLFNTVAAQVPNFSLRETAGAAPLPEDIELLGFSPLQGIFGGIDFSKPELDSTGDQANIQRCSRVLTFAVTVAPTISMGSTKLIYSSGTKFDVKPLATAETPKTSLPSSSVVPNLSTSPTYEEAHIPSAQPILGSSAFSQASQHIGSPTKFTLDGKSPLPNSNASAPSQFSGFQAGLGSKQSPSVIGDSPSLMSILAGNNSTAPDNHGLGRSTFLASSTKTIPSESADFDDAGDIILFRGADVTPVSSTRPPSGVAPIGAERIASRNGPTPAIHRPRQLFEEDDDDEQTALDVLRNDTSMAARLLPSGLLTNDPGTPPPANASIERNTILPFAPSIGLPSAQSASEFVLPFAQSTPAEPEMSNQMSAYMAGMGLWGGPTPWSSSSSINQPLGTGLFHSGMPNTTPPGYWVPPMGFGGLPSSSLSAPPGFGAPPAFNHK